MPETEYHHMALDDLREEAKRRGMSGVWDMRKEELVAALERDGGASSSGEGSSSGESGVRTGPGSSDSLKYAQEITSPDEEEERPGKTLVTTDHDVIKQWAEERDATPATVPGTEHGEHLGVLRFDFPGYGGDDLQEVSWDDWFATFDARKLNFLYQEHKSDGSQSNFFRLESPEREDA